MNIRILEKDVIVIRNFILCVYKSIKYDYSSMIISPLANEKITSNFGVFILRAFFNFDVSIIERGDY